MGELPQEVFRTGLTDKARLPVLQAEGTQSRLWASETDPGSSLALSLSLDDLEPVISPLGASVS